jgi:hypothetical protein
MQLSLQELVLHQLELHYPNTSSIKFGSRLILSRAPLIAAAPNFGAVTVDNPP